MWDDSIVAETRQTREQIAARFDYDIWALGEYFKTKRAAEAVELVANAALRTRKNPVASAATAEPPQSVTG